MVYHSDRQPIWTPGPHSKIKMSSPDKNKNCIFLNYLLLKSIVKNYLKF